MITYKQQHGVIYMGKNVTLEHKDAWARWKMSILILLHKGNIKESLKKDLVLVTGQSHIILQAVFPISRIWSNLILSRICWFLPPKFIYFLPCIESMVEVLNHASKSFSCVSKLKSNGWKCHPFIGDQNHGKICDANFGFLCYNNNFYWFVNV